MYLCYDVNFMIVNPICVFYNIFYVSQRFLSYVSEAENVRNFSFR